MKSNKLKFDNYSNVYGLVEAINLLKNLAKDFKKFDESVDIECYFDFSRLSKSSIFKNFSILPFGSGQKRCVAVFYDNKMKIDELKYSGADEVFFDDFFLLLKDRKKLTYSYLITTEKLISFLKPYSSLLGPLGLLPNLKCGTLALTDESISSIIYNCKWKQINYTIDSIGALRCSVGRISFTTDEIEKNIYFLLCDVFKNNFPQFYFDFLRIIRLSTTMGPSLQITIESVTKKCNEKI